MSLTVTCSVALLDGPAAGLREGAHVVVHAKPQFYAARGTLSLYADQIRQVGVGELLARLEHLRSVLAAEGLFAADRKRPLPFLPGVVGVVCGRASAAEKDVVENGRRRWPAVRFRVEEVAVQGPTAVTEVTDGAAAPRRRPRGRRHRRHPRRRLARGPAAVLQRGAGPRGRRLPDAGRQRDRPRGGHPAARPGRRRPRLDPDRRGQAGRPRRRRGARPGRPAAPAHRGRGPRAARPRGTPACGRCAAGR